MVSKVIKQVMQIKGVTNAELSRHYNVSQQAMSNKFYRNTFSAEELIDVLDYMNCELVIRSKDNIDIVMSKDKD